MVCNYRAPNGEKSQLYEGLSALLGPEKAHMAWNILRGEQIMKDTQKWEFLEKDVNGEPLLQTTLSLLRLGSLANIEQHVKFVSRWNLRPVPGTFNRYFGSKQLAMKMHEQLKHKSKELYNLLEISYDATSAHIVINPVPIQVVHRLVQPETRTEEFTEAAKLMKDQLEQRRKDELREASKPYGTLQFILDPTLLNRTVEQEVEVEGTDETMTRTISVKRWQANIRKDYEVFNKLVKCVQ